MFTHWKKYQKVQFLGGCNAAERIQPSIIRNEFNYKRGHKRTHERKYRKMNLFYHGDASSEDTVAVAERGVVEMFVDWGTPKSSIST